MLMVALVTSGRKEVEEERLSGPDLHPSSRPPLKWLLFVCLFFKNLFRVAQGLEMTFAFSIMLLQSLDTEREKQTNIGSVIVANTLDQE